MNEPSSTLPTPLDDPSPDRLDSWKDIANYLKRDISTVQRWERREAMPVHRHLHDYRGSVYAFRSELDRWIASRGLAVQSAGTVELGVAAPAQPTRPAQRRFLRPLAAAAVVLALGFGASRVLRPAKQGLPAIRSVAVLPLQNLSGDASQEYFADGMTESVIGYLTSIRGLHVISRTSAMQFKGTHQSVPEIAAKLSVDAVVEGSVIRAADRVRVHVQMIRGRTDEHVWSATYDRELRDVLTLETQIAFAIARQVQITVSAHDDGRTASRAVAADVYDNYLKGRFALNRNTRAGATEGIGYFEAAIAADPSFAPAYSGIASAYTDLGLVLFGGPPREARPKAIAAARKALSLDPNLIEAHIQLGDALQKDWQWKEAEAEFRRAVELAPNSAMANAMVARYLICRGRFDEAVAAAEKARSLDPLALRAEHLGWILFMSRRYKEAIRAIEDVLATRPDDPTALWELGFARLLDGEPGPAVAALERAADITHRGAAVLGVLVHAYAAAGRSPDASRTLDEMHHRRVGEYVAPAALVNAYAGLRDRDQTFLWLERAISERSNIVQYLIVHPGFDFIRSDPRFADLVRRVGLAD
jgi:TolB-like protein/tetratricopeptide (TPR) repeat protein